MFLWLSGKRGRLRSQKGEIVKQIVFQKNYNIKSNHEVVAFNYDAWRFCSFFVSLDFLRAAAFL